jgi:hypothetical protein
VSPTQVSLWSEAGSRAWYQRFAFYAHQLGFVASKSDVSLFIYKSDTEVAYILLYVDDIIIITASTPVLLRYLTQQLHSEFAMTDLGALSYFLGISVSRTTSGMVLSQRQYALDLL